MYWRIIASYYKKCFFFVSVENEFNKMSATADVSNSVSTTHLHSHNKRPVILIYPTGKRIIFYVVKQILFYLLIQCHLKQWWFQLFPASSVSRFWPFWSSAVCAEEPSWPANKRAEETWTLITVLSLLSDSAL